MLIKPKYHAPLTWTIIYLVVFSIISTLFNKCCAQSEFRFNKTEYFTVSTSIDPYASYNEKGLDIVGELEYVGTIYAKIGFESFSELQGGYNDFHGAIGLNFTSGMYEHFRYYIGGRVAKVNRNGGFRINPGLEAGIDVELSDNFTIGARATLDNRLDQELLGWNPEKKFSGFIRLSYKWYWKGYKTTN